MEHYTCVSFYDVCRAIGITPNAKTFNPRTVKEMEAAKQRLIELFEGNENEAEETLSLAMAGEVQLLKNMYP